MSNIFIFSNSFMTRSLLLLLDFIVNFKIKKIFLLKENHNAEIDFTGCKFQVEMFHTLNECIKLADIVIIAYYDCLPKTSIKFITDTCEKQDKICIQVPGLYLSMDKSMVKVEKIVNYNNIGCPVILNIATNIFSQQFCGELKINQMLMKYQILFRQIFSDCTEEILQQFCKYNILNQELKKQLDNKEKVYDIFVVPMTLENLLSKNNRTKNEIIDRLCPDSIVVQVDSRNENIERIFNIIYQYFGRNPNAIIKSHYKKINSEYLVYCNELDFINSGDYRVLDLESEKLISKLKWCLLPEISLPQGVIRM